MKIHNLGNYSVNIFVIEQASGLIIVDSGYHSKFDSFVCKFQKQGFKPEDVRYIFLTHCHDDHTGCLNELLDYTKAPLILHNDAVDRLKSGHNGQNYGASSKTLQFIIKRLIKKEKSFPPVDRPERYLIFNGTQQYLEDNGMLGEIVSLPGHTCDSIGILMPDKSILCGDTIMNMPITRHYQPLVLENIQDLKISWKYIIDNTNLVITSHGKSLPTKKLAKEYGYLDSLVKYDIF